VAGVPSPPVGPADSDRAPARLERIAVRADGLEGRELDVVSGQTEVEVSVSFRSNPALRAPSVALTLMTPEGRVVSSAGSKNDGIVLAMDASGHGTARVRFPRFPLLKGIYFVHVYLMCEEGVHIYESALSVAELRVSQIGLERGLVKLPRAWRAAPGPGEGYWDALSPARTVSAR
jgi:lipopolysaccharide transport system ATP-binding protein